MGKKILIIGGVAGGATAAARLRRLDGTVDIIILEKGDYISYANCGLPYYVGEVIQNRESLLLSTPEQMKDKYNIEVRVNNEAVAIDKERKVVTIKQVTTGESYEESYDILLIATGSSPLKPPIPGIDGPGIYTLWTVPDTDRIKSFVTQQKPKRAAVIGGGFIGLEMAENLHAVGCEVSVIEMQDQVMAPLDFEMAQLLHENMEKNNINLVLNDGVKTFDHKEGVTSILLQSGKVVEAELVILSIGVRPNSELAKAAGLSLNERGGIIVDEYLKTSDPNIYAVGDVIEVEEFVSKGRTMIPLAGPANKQGRICAGNIAKELGLISGEPKAYNGTQGTSIARVFDLSAATTGVNEKTLKKWGLEFEKDYFITQIVQNSHAGYYPGATQLHLKLLFDKDGKILGAQIVGQEGVDKRIDVLSTTMRLGGTIHDLTELELAYAPPFSSAKDPVNMLGFVSENILAKMVRFSQWDELERNEKDQNHVLLDVTEDIERMVFTMPDSYHIPLGQLGVRMDELDKDTPITTLCAIGVRSYNAARKLQNAGFKNVKVYPGGTSFYKSTHHPSLKNQNASGILVQQTRTNDEGVSEIEDKCDIHADGAAWNPAKIVAHVTVDCSGLQCPGPIMKVFQTMNNMLDGEILKISATDMGFPRDIEAWCKRTGNTMLLTEQKGKEYMVYIQKGIKNGSLSSNQGSATTQGPMSLPQGKTMVVFSGDLDKVLASFVIANGAASLGRPVTMFFTFWGLNALRKTEKQHIKKPLIDSMFGMMMPRGTTKLGLSNMNMGGMGTKMMKKVMKDKNVDSLEALMKQALFNGVKIVACTMSMDIMGITKDELIDGIEYAGVATYLADAEESNVNLFI